MIACATPDALSGFLDGELAGGELRRVETHLAECPSCRARLDSLRRVVGELGRLERAAPPPLLAQYVERRIALAPARRDPLARLEGRLRGLGLASPAVASFAVVLALASMLYLFAHGLDRHRRRPVPMVVATPEASREFVASHPHLEGWARVDGRLFERTGDRWLEAGLAARSGEAPQIAATVAADSAEGRRLLAASPGLADLLRGADGVVLADGGRVIELCPAGAAR